MKDKKAFKTNLIFTVVLLLVAAGSFLWLRQRPTGAVATVTYGDEGKTIQILLKEDKRYDLDTGYYTVHLEVKNGRIAFVDAPCPDHICENYGWLSKDGDWAACLPARANVTVLEGD